MNKRDQEAEEIYDRWVLSPAGEQQRRYDFEQVERSQGQAEAIRQDVVWERHVTQARMRKINRDMMDDFRRNGYDDPDIPF